MRSRRASPTRIAAARTSLSRSPTRTLLLGLASMVTRALLVSCAVATQRRRARRGDAEAVLNAFGNGGWAVINHSDVARRGVVDQQIQIRPFDFFDGRHYCALDWHTIVIADIEGGDRPFTRQQAEALIADVRVQFTLDGAPLRITQTAVKRFLNPQLFGLQAAFYSQWGRVMRPSDLDVGEHTLNVRMTNASGSQVYFENTINFFIDAEGTGTCR
jgi:hypothetical protein